jgi:hypothetical protein
MLAKPPKVRRHGMARHHRRCAPSRGAEAASAPRVVIAAAVWGLAAVSQSCRMACWGHQNSELGPLPLQLAQLDFNPHKQPLEAPA